MENHHYLPLSGNCDANDAIRAYFRIGFSYYEIRLFLAVYHDVQISPRTLTRKLRALGLRRNTIRQGVNWDYVLFAIEEELSGSGSELGYRAMQARLRHSYHIQISRENVRLLLRHMDPCGVKARQRSRLRRRRYTAKGPNYLYHVDGWDKLKRYGLCIHGCIDGFSRRIMWLEAAASNNNPQVICNFFVNCIGKLQGLPCVVRADRGSENVNLELMQRILRQVGGGRLDIHETTFLYGSSPANQRIEAWWSKFPSLAMEAWICHFAQLADSGVIDTSKQMDLECVRYVYMDLLRSELERTKVLWNTHYIRSSRLHQTPAGKPDVLYHLPELFGVHSHLKPLDNDSLAVLSPLLTTSLPTCGPLYQALFDSVMEELQLQKPTRLREAATILATILDTVEHESQHV